MNKLCQLLDLKSEDELFYMITQSFKTKITKWNYFVNWLKVLRNIKPIEVELNILNVLIGKENVEEEAYQLLKKYPNILKAIPILLAIREKSVEVLIESKEFIYRKFTFHDRELSDEECKELAAFIIHSGFGKLLADKKIKNLVDYALGVEVGLDSNGRKNRVGTLMEELVEDFVIDSCKKLNLEYLSQATAARIKEKWGIEIKVDESLRKIDFAVNKKGKLYFIETNFYGGGGSKLKSTATEYIEMKNYWNKQGIEFIWITDGAGWKLTLNPLREYFDKSDYLLNLNALKNDVLTLILK